MDTEYRRAANITVIVAGLALLTFVIFKYALGAVAPFILAAIIAAAVAPAAKKISKKSKIPLKLISAVLVISIFLVVSGLLYLAVSRLIAEVGNLLERLSDNPEAVSQALESFTDRFTQNGSKFKLLYKIFESDYFKELGINIDKILQSALESLVSSLSSSLPSAAVAIVSRIPSIFLFVIVLLLSAFYFSADGDRISRSLTSVLPRSWQARLPLIKRKFSNTLSGYLKAYLLIMLITFLEMFVGLSVLGVRYAFLLSMIIAVVDILPILGTGAVLVPWAIFSFITSNVRLGTGLLVLYATTLIIRQFIEPKIVGRSLGLHPLATLASVYLGLELLGVSGILIGPMVALLLKELFFEASEPQTQMVKKV